MEPSEAQAGRPPDRSYLICSTGRTGSSLLSSTVNSLNCCGHPIEYFHLRRLRESGVLEDPEALRPYLAEVLMRGTTDNGVFGSKIHWEQFRALLDAASQWKEFGGANEMEIVRGLFPRPRFLFIWRRDTIGQAISREIATQTEVWGIKRGKAPMEPKREPVFRPLKIYRHKLHVEAANREWRHFFHRHGITPREVIYEEFVPNFQETIRRTVEYVGGDPGALDAEIPMARKKQGTGINARWNRYYRLLPEPVWGAAYAVARLF